MVIVVCVSFFVLLIAYLTHRGIGLYEKQKDCNIKIALGRDGFIFEITPKDHNPCDENHDASESDPPTHPQEETSPQAPQDDAAQATGMKFISGLLASLEKRKVNSRKMHRLFPHQLVK